LVAGLMLLVSVVGAEEPQSLTLKTAREIALKNHPRITQAELEALAAKQVVTEIRAGSLPNLAFDATAVGTGNRNNTRLAAGHGLSNSAIYERNAEGLTLTQLITDFGRTQHLLNSSRLQSRAQQETTQAMREAILLQADVAYFAALKAQSVLAVARQTLATCKLLLDQVTALAQNKLRSDLDLSFAKVTYEEGRLLVAKAETDLKAAFTALGTWLGDRVQRTYQLIEEPTPVPGITEPDNMIDTALARRPDLARLRLEHEATVQFAQAQKALRYPTISAFGSGGFIPVRDESHLNDRYAAAGVNLSGPLFDGGLNAAKQSEAEYRSQAAEEKLRDAENTAINDVRTASLNTNYAVERLDLTQKLFDNARQAFNLAQACYKVGSTAIIELSQAQLSQTTAEIAHTGAKYDYQIQRAILDFQTGTMRWPGTAFRPKPELFIITLCKV
jgi:outer membrane protein